MRKPIIVAIILIVSLLYTRYVQQKPQDSSKIEPTPTVVVATATPTVSVQRIYYPIDKYSARLNYRFYSTQVTGDEPKNLPCGFPFNGLHTGADLEALENESSPDIGVYAITEGKVLQIGEVNGYGGLIVISHRINNADFTAYYGHIRLKSVMLKKGDSVRAGQKIAYLGSGCSKETDNERQHLHFGIHSGKSIDQRGYVSTPQELRDWIDPSVFLQQNNATEADPSQVLGATSNTQRVVARVSKVVDGDTFELSTGEKVRMIGIDTPETVDPRRAVGCFGKDASEKTKELILEKDVTIEKDVSETDRYRRLLRYVWVGDVFINEYLVKEGFALASSYPPDIKYQDRFRSAQKEAQDNKRGLWGAACS